MIRILVARKLDDHGILVKFQRNFDQNSFQGLNDYGILQGFWSLLFSRIRWPQNSFEILQGFRSEFWWPQKFQRDFDQNSFQDLNDHGILQGIQMATEFFKDFDQNYFQELDETEFLWNSLRILIRILVASISFQQIRWLSNSSRIRILWNSSNLTEFF